MITLRKVHLYLGCLFAPMLIFFTLTGVLQTFELHESRKNGYTAPKIVEEMSEIHLHQRLVNEQGGAKSSLPIKIFILMMSVGLIITTVLGVVMALKFTKKRSIVYLCLIMGVVLPVIFLLMDRFK